MKNIDEMQENTVLIVDDEDTIRQLLADVLSDKNCTVQLAGSAEEALGLLQKTVFSVAMIDIRLPGMNGIDFLEKLKEISPDTVAMMITSHASLTTAIGAIRRGAYDYLSKPFEDVDEVWLAVERALENRRLTVENRELVQNLQQRNKQLSTTVSQLTSLIKAGQAMSSIYDLPELLDYFVGLVADTLGVARASIMLKDDGGEEMYIAASRGVQDDVVKNTRVKVGEGISGRVADLGKPILVKNVNTDPRMPEVVQADLSDSFISSPIVLSVPIKLQETVLGVINVTNKKSKDAFNKKDMAFMYGLGGQAAVAIEAAKHMEDLQNAYASLKASQAQLVSSERLNALGGMAAGVAHDFNNILHGIMGAVQLLLLRLESEDLKAADMKSKLKLIEKNTFQGMDIVKRVQDFSRIRKDHPDEVVDLNKAVQDALEITRARWKSMCEANGITIEPCVELGEIPCTIGNARELMQVAGNLIFNAVEAMPQGGRLFLKTFQENDLLCLEVADTGSGIKEENLERLLEPFFTTKETGQGLGLSIVFGIVARHGGQITFRNAEDQGAIFRVSLPSTHLKANPSNVDEKNIPQERREVQFARILLVDDEEINRFVFQEMLETMGYEVETAKSASEALVRLASSSFNLLITDLSMPDMSGLDLAKKAKEINANIPIILLSGWAGQQDEAKAKQDGIDCLLTKPCSMNQLIESVEKSLAVSVSCP